MEAKQKIGCINCRTTKGQIGHHQFQIVTGKRYQAYFCYPCFELFHKEFEAASPAKQVEYLNNLSTLIIGRN